MYLGALWGYHERMQTRGSALYSPEQEFPRVCRCYNFEEALTNQWEGTRSDFKTNKSNNSSRFLASKKAINKMYKKDWLCSRKLTIAVTNAKQKQMGCIDIPIMLGTSSASGLAAVTTHRPFFKRIKILFLESFMPNICSLISNKLARTLYQSGYEARNLWPGTVQRDKECPADLPGYITGKRSESQDKQKYICTYE